MVEGTNIIQKTINDKTYYYDKILDVIHEGTYEPSAHFNRTQVSQAVDLCLESTTWCNWECQNCFSESARGSLGTHIDVDWAIRTIESLEKEIIRICITGGEPFMHPYIETLLRLPESANSCGFVINTNGTLRPELDDLLVDYGWLTALSLHGGKEAHEWYSRWGRFEDVVGRIERLANNGIVHIYSVLHDGMRVEDVDWLLRFRDESGVAFLRFILPRPFGRYRPLLHEELEKEVESRLDERSGLKSRPSNTRFLSVDGVSRTTN